jgi:hypothetical protein
MRIRDRLIQYIEEVGDPVEYTYTSCPRCSSPILLSRAYDYDEGGSFRGAYRREYPPLGRRIGFATPIAVRNAYDEAVRCEDAKAWMAVAVMVGRALEAICRDFDDTSTSIADGLRKMLDAGAISQELYEWGDGLRLVRNEGAHATQVRVSRKDATFALDFLQALIEILFDLRERFEIWRQDRAERAARRTARIGAKGAVKVPKVKLVPKRRASSEVQ